MRDEYGIEKNLKVYKTYYKIDEILKKYKNPYVSYSGGSDSDTMLFILNRLGYKIPAIFFDTGFEYDATINHLHNMISMGHDIKVVKSKYRLPSVIAKYGIPFQNKIVSERISRLQKHNFDFKNDGGLDFNELVKKYPNTKSAMQWWCNKNKSASYNIDEYNVYLKDFLIENGLDFKVSSECCTKIKKDIAKDFANKNKVDLMILGIRKIEGGIRLIYKNCFSSSKKYPYDMFFPLFWWDDNLKNAYDKIFNIQHSDCYTKYGLDRTGCIGCPFGRSYKKELEILKIFEPKKYKMANFLFRKSYDLKEKYDQYKAKKKKESSL